MSTDDRSALGCCACGGVKFVITLPVKGCVNCHCHYCRRTHGAAFVTWCGVRRENFRLSGQENLKWFQGSDETRRGFCQTCGTPLFFLSSQWPEDIHVTRASLSLNAREEIVPRFHVHFDKRVDWYSCNDSLPRLGGDDGTTPLD